MQTLYTIQTVSRKLGVTAQTVRKWIAAGRLRSLRPEGMKAHLITEDSLRAFLAPSRLERPEISANASEDVRGFFADEEQYRARIIHARPRNRLQEELRRVCLPAESPAIDSIPETYEQSHGFRD